MADPMNETRDAGTPPTMMSRARRMAWVAILVVEVGILIWGAMAALVPDYLLGPRSTPILVAGYEGFTNGSWSELVRASPATADYIAVLFRLYGSFNVAFALPAIALTVTAFRRGDAWAWWGLLAGNTIALGAAMRYDWIVNAIGPFELTEYLGLALVYAALGVTAPFFVARQLRRSIA